jgi:hypothetical protein
VDYLFNEKSFHGQFYTLTEFQKAVETVMLIRNQVMRYGVTLFCHREVQDAQVTPDCVMKKAVNSLPKAQRQAWILWLTQSGPFWFDERRHSDGDWLELEDGSLVTDSSIGEAAYRNMLGSPSELITVEPSNWLNEKIRVIFKQESSRSTSADVINRWTLKSVEQSLEALAPPYDSWQSLEIYVRRKCELLRFCDDAFSYLRGHPFVACAAKGIEVQLTTLNTYRGSFNEDGSRTPDGDRIYNSHFAHGKAWFTDSSDSEKSEFRKELTFPHPERPGEYLFCTWHGKVKTPPIRIHFSWPITANSPVYIAYVGPKITKQ